MTLVKSFYLKKCINLVNTKKCLNTNMITRIWGQCITVGNNNSSYLFRYYNGYTLSLVAWVRATLTLQ